MNRKISSSAPRTPNIKKPNLPQLSRLRGHSETPTGHKSELNSYYLGQDNSFNLHSVRKFFTPTNIAKTAIPSTFRIDTEFKEELSTKPALNNSYWEIKERTESYELRIKSGMVRVTDEFDLWNQCCVEIIPLIKQQSPELGEVFTKVIGNLSNLFKDLEKTFAESQKNVKSENQKFRKKIKTLEEECNLLKSTIDSLKTSERLEMEQIQKEIEELFGNEESEQQLLKFRPKGGPEPVVSTADYLKEVYNQMNKDYTVPEKHFVDYPALNMEEFTQTIHSKFKLLQKSTAFRIMKVIEGKNKNSFAVQTTAKYVNPKDHEDLTAGLEKLNVQYQSAIMTIDRLKEENTSKFNQIENIENEKIHLFGENARFKRDLENLQKENLSAKVELNLVKAELAKVVNAKNVAAAEGDAINQLNIKISGLNKKNENLNSSLKEKDEKIKLLEDKLEKIRLKKSEKPEKTEEPDLSIYKNKEKSKESGTENSHESSRFDDIISSSKSRKSKQSTSRNPMRGSKNSDSQSTVRDNSEDQDQIYTLSKFDNQDDDSQISSNRNLDPTRPESKMSASHIQDTRSTSSTPAEKFKSVYEGSMPTRVNSRDAPLARVDETRELKGTLPADRRDLRDFKDFKDNHDSQYGKDSVNNKSSRDHKDQRGAYGREVKEVKDAKEGPYKSEKVAKGYEKRMNLSKNSFNQYDSEEEYQINKNLQWETLLNKGVKSSGFDGGEEKVLLGKDGIEYSVVDKGVWTTDDLKMIQVTNYSKSVQVNDGVALEHNESKNSISRNIYFLPYNPNNAYGLRGETYFNSKNQVFGAQPRIPDLANSVFFQNSYFLDKSSH